jgi:hypothetical protein
VSLSKSTDNNWPAIVAGLFAVAALSLGLLSFERSAIAIPPIPSRDSAIMPPTDWKASAAPGDVLDVPGYDVAYWGRPVGDVISRWNGKVTRAGYSSESTAKKKRPVAVIIHYTRGRKAIDGPIVTRVIKVKVGKKTKTKTKVIKERRWKRDVPEPEFSKRFVKYQHNGDASRGGNHFGYHVYAFPSGDIVQGAPLSVRTNHIKPRGPQIATRWRASQQPRQRQHDWRQRNGWVQARCQAVPCCPLHIVANNSHAKRRQSLPASRPCKQAVRHVVSKLSTATASCRRIGGILRDQPWLRRCGTLANARPRPQVALAVGAKGAEFWKRLQFVYSIEDQDIKRIDRLLIQQ